MMDYQEENCQVLKLVQALVGFVTPNFRMVTLEVSDTGAVTLTFLLEKDSAEDREEISDIVFEFEALQERGRAVGVRLVIDDRPFQLIGLTGRRVYGRKEPE